MPLFIPVRKWLYCTMGVFVSMLGKLTSPTFELLLMGFMKMYIYRYLGGKVHQHRCPIIPKWSHELCGKTALPPSPVRPRRWSEKLQPHHWIPPPWSVKQNQAVYCTWLMWLFTGGNIAKKDRVFICITYGGYFYNLVNKSVSIKISATWRNDILTDFG